MAAQKSWRDKNCFSVSLHNRCKAKLNRLKDGSGRPSIANVIEYLIAKEDETAAEWNAVCTPEVTCEEPHAAR